LAWQRCDALIVLEEALVEPLQRFVGSECPPVFVVHHGITPRRTPLARGNGRAELLFFGKIRRNKGLHVLLKAFETLHGFQLTVAGDFDPADPAYARDMRARIKEAGAAVTFIEGHASEANRRSLFEGAGIVVLPYTAFASQSGVLMDAIEFGRPVVGTDVGALGHSIADLGIGNAVAANDPKALASAIEELARPATYDRAVAQMARVQSDRSWEAGARATLGIYSKFL
jgi:glycosyltransferase involved in cell wall biosynthesis